MFCSNCGANVPEGSGFCASCGTPVAAEKKIAPAPSLAPTPKPEPKPEPKAESKSVSNDIVIKGSLRSLMAMLLGIVGATAGLIVAIVSIIYLVDGTSALYGFGLVAITAAVVLTAVASIFALVLGVKAKKAGERSSFAVVGIVFGIFGILFAIVSLIFVIIVACRPGDYIENFINGTLKPNNRSWSDHYRLVQQQQNQIRTGGFTG